MNKLQELKNRCKCGVYIEINPHKDVYESVEKNIFEDDKEDIEEEILKEMIKRDTIVRIQFYPNTPVGCYVIYHYDIEKGLDYAIKILNENLIK